MKRVICILVFIVVLLGCGTQTEQLMDWSNLHRVGPNTVARVYYWDQEKQTWFLSDSKYVIPEGHYIAPPPSVNNNINTSNQ